MSRSCVLPRISGSKEITTIIIVEIEYLTTWHQQSLATIIIAAMITSLKTIITIIIIRETEGRRGGGRLSQVSWRAVCEIAASECACRCPWVQYTECRIQLCVIHSLYTQWIHSLCTLRMQGCIKQTAECTSVCVSRWNKKCKIQLTLWLLNKAKYQMQILRLTFRIGR